MVAMWFLNATLILNVVLMLSRRRKKFEIYVLKAENVDDFSCVGFSKFLSFAYLLTREI